MIKCKVCGHEFQPVLKNHYISRDCEKSSSSVVTFLDGRAEGSLYDSFDCPACGCQSTPQERKRVYVIPSHYKAEEEDENEASTEAETD